MNLNGTPELPILAASVALQNYLNTTRAGATGDGGSGIATSNPIPDPGDVGTISVTDSGYLGLTHTTGIEIRVLPDPAFVGQEIIMYLDQDLDAYGGKIDVGTANGFGPAGGVAQFDAVGQCAIFYGVKVGGSLRWRVERALNNAPLIVP